MADIIIEHSAQYIIANSALYITPNWNGDYNRVAMSCGGSAFFRAYIPLFGIQLNNSDFPRSWSMTARNTILRHNGDMYLYARVERDGDSGMYIWSRNVYDVDGRIAGDTESEKSDQYYYIMVGYITAPEYNETSKLSERTVTLDYGSYGTHSGDLGADGATTLPYSWQDILRLEEDADGNRVVVFLHHVYNIVLEAITIAGVRIRKILTKSDEPSADGSERDDALVTEGFLSNWIAKLRGSFLRKDNDDDNSTHTLTLGNMVIRNGGRGKTASFEESADGIGGKGAAIWESSDQEGYVETDFLNVRRAAYFRSITISEVNHMGGELILSAAACQIARVAEIYDDMGTLVAYRCFFERKANGREVYNEWVVDDLARCQRWDANGNTLNGTYYWRRVVATSNGLSEDHADYDKDCHWVDLSNKRIGVDYDYGSNAPSVNDNIVLLGHDGKGHHDRTCAQIYSTVGRNAPSRAYYEGCGQVVISGIKSPFTLPSPIELVEWKDGRAHWRVGNSSNYIDFNGGLDIRTSSMTVIADGGDKEIDVAEVLGDSWSFFTTENEARKEGKDYVEWMAAAELVPNEADQWDNSVWRNYLNYQIITPHGITYKLDMNGDEVMWHLNTDRYLLHAQETADAAVKNLDDMASDNVITLQEKPRLNDIYTQINEEGANVFNDATQVGMRDTDTRVYRTWRSALMAMINYIVSREGDVELVKENGEQLVVTMQRYDSIPSVSYDVPDVVVSPMTPDPTAHKVTYKDCYKWYYYRLSQVRQAITVAMRRSIDNIVVNGSDVNEYVRGEISNLRDGLQETNGIVSKLDGDIGALATIVHYPDESVEFSGFVTKSNFASVFSSETSKDGNEVSAIITAYVNKGVSGISLSADKIDFAAADITMFSNNFRIDADNFKVNRDGVYVRGEIHATSGTFDGTVKASQGFQLGYKSVRYVEENRDEDEATILDKGDSVVFVEYRVEGPGVILPQQPLDGQVVKIISTGSFPVRVYSNNSDIVRLGSQSRSVTVPAHSVGEFIYGQNKWYYTGNYNCS